MQTIFDTAKEQISFDGLLQLSEELLLQGKTTGSTQTEEYLHYAKLNLQRMKRLKKTFAIPENKLLLLKNARSQKWYVISEAWCGDGAQNLPILSAIAQACNIPLNIVLRDDNPNIINQYLTNGSKSIPILVSFDNNGKQLFRWGPRPVAAQELLLKWKSEPNPRPFEVFEEEMHRWYTQNKGIDTLNEIIDLMK